jgi:heat shock protein HspQ
MGSDVAAQFPIPYSPFPHSPSRLTCLIDRRAPERLSTPPHSHGAGMDKVRHAKYRVGQVVRHRIHEFRGLIFDVDPVFNNSEEWWLAIPAEMRPRKDQPFYHLFAENAETEYIAYVSEQNLLPDVSGRPLRHPQIAELFAVGDDGTYRFRLAH